MNKDEVIKKLNKKEAQETDIPIRLNKYLSDAGFCSRREADRLIEAGSVFIDERRAALGDKVAKGQKVTVNGKPIQPASRMILLALNKPEGIECTTDALNPDNIVDFIHYPERVYPIGRLDKNSTGLILLTNTGELVNRILKSSNFHEKEYVVEVDHELSDSFLKKMRSGVKIEIDNENRTVVTRKCKVCKTGSKTFTIILTQGYNRQIRRMCSALGYRVVKLKRVRIMNICLGRLPEGSWREVTKAEVDELIRQL